MIMDGSEIGPSDLPLTTRSIESADPQQEDVVATQGESPSSELQTLDDLERDHIKLALTRSDGNRFTSREGARYLAKHSGSKAKKVRPIGGLFMIATVAPRDGAGWRTGRPVEDPYKTKRWGFITAKPSEFLIHVRNGQPTHRSGQGATCFKWPWDSVAIIPTSLQRLQFRADQITLEKIGVEVVGFAAYRIADPLLAYRVLNFSYPERAQEKLEQTLTNMFVGATRRIVATLSVESCLTKRKSAVAEELLREIAPVVGGEGRPEDPTSKGWGVVIDTIEIQEVRVLSEKVFAAMQAPFRAELDKKAATKQAEARQQIEESKLRAEASVREQRAALEKREAESKAEAEIKRSALRVKIAEAELASHEIRKQAQLKAAETKRLEKELDVDLRRNDAEIALVEGQTMATVELQRAHAAYRQAEAESKLVLAQNMPALANAMGQKIQEVKIAQYGGDKNPFAQVTGGIAALMDVLKEQ